MDLSNLKREIKEYISSINDESGSVINGRSTDNDAGISIFTGGAAEQLVKTIQEGNINRNKIKNIFENITGADSSCISAVNFGGIEKELEKIKRFNGLDNSEDAELGAQNKMHQDNKVSLPLKFILPEQNIEIKSSLETPEYHSSKTVQAKPVQLKGGTDGRNLEELNEQKNVKEKELKEADAAYIEAANGSSESIKAAKEETQKEKNNLNNLLSEEKFIDTKHRIAAKGAQTDVDHAQKDFDKAKRCFRNVMSEIPKRKAAVQNDEAELSRLKSALASLDEKDGKAAADLRAKIKAAECRLKKDEFILKALEAAAEYIKYMIGVTKERLDKAEAFKNKLEAEYTKQKADISKQIRNMERSYKEAEDNEERTAVIEEKTAKDVLNQAQNELKIISEKIEKIKNSEEDNKSAGYDYDKNLTEEQRSRLEKIKENYKNNKEKYEKISEETGLPAPVTALMLMNEKEDIFISADGDITAAMIKAFLKEMQ